MGKNQKAPYKRQITIMIILICFISIFAGYVIDLLMEIRGMKSELRTSLEQEAKIISDHCALPLEFNYPENAMEVLRKLEVNPDIQCAVLFDTNNNVFASYYKDSVFTVQNSSIAPKISINIKQGEIYFPVNYIKKQHGTLLIRQNSRISQLLIQEAFSASVIITAIVFLVMLIAGPLQRMITAPIDRTIKENEVRWRFALEGTGSGVWDWNLKTNNVFFSDVWKTMLGYQPNQLDNKFSTWEKAVHPTDINKAKQLIEDYLGNRINEFKVEHRLKCKDGSYKWILSKGEIAEYDTNGDPLRFVGTHTDISMQKQSEILLNDAKEKAQESDRLKSAFLANMSHEIRTPLNGVVGFCDLLNNNEDATPKIKGYTEIIMQSAQRLLDIVNDVLDISKIETGQIEVKYESFALNKVINEIYDFYTKKNSKPLEIIVENGLNNGEDQIECDKTKLFQILNNLISNAIKFTMEGSITVAYSLDGSMLHFSVKDTGIGIPEKYQNIIFERFRQAEMDLDKQFGGTGLGLSIAQKFIEMLGGDIWMESTEGKGTTFYFTIPYKSHGKEMMQGDPEINQQEDLVNGKRPTILVADDEEINLKFLEEGLGEMYKLLMARDGGEAVQIARGNSKIDLILMDVRMPVLNGIDAMRQIKEFKPSLTIIAQTAYAMSQDRQKLLDLGFDEYCPKPINLKHLKSIIKKYTVKHSG